MAAMEKLPNVGDTVRVISAPILFAHLVGKVGLVYDIGRSGTTAAVRGADIYFTKEQLEAA